MKTDKNMEQIKKFYNWLQAENFYPVVGQDKESLFVNIETDYIDADVELRLDGEKWVIDNIDLGDSRIDLDSLENLHSEIFEWFKPNLDYYNEKYMGD